MPSGSSIPLHNPLSDAFTESRILDLPDLRLAEIRCGSAPGTVGVVRDRLLQSFPEFGLSGDTAPPQACMAIEEALANAVYHGNLELDSEMKEDDSCSFIDLARERCVQKPWRDRVIHVSELVTPFGLWITIRDEGRGFDSAAALQKAAHPDALLASGRGLLMMQAFSDELIFNRAGNEVTLVFYGSHHEDVVQMMRHRRQQRETGKPGVSRCSAVGM